MHVFKMNPNSADKTTLELPFNRQEANWMQSSHGQESTLRSLVFNSTVIQALNAEYTGYYDMYEKLVVQLDAVVRSVELYNPDTDKILFYSEASEVPVEDYLLPIERIQSSAWKDTVMADGYPHWFSDNNSDVFLAQKIVNLRGENRPNILYLKPDSKALFQPLLDIADEDFGFYILENDTVISCLKNHPQILSRWG